MLDLEEIAFDIILSSFTTFTQPLEIQEGAVTHGE